MEPPAKAPARSTNKTGKSRAATERSIPLSVRRERVARTKAQHARVEQVLRDRPGTDFGDADKTELYNRVKDTLKRVNIEQYSDKRLKRSRGLPRSWIGDVWEDVVSSLRGVWKFMAGRAAEEVRALNGELRDGGAVRINRDGLVDRIRDLPADQRPKAFDGTIEMLTDVRLVSKTSADPMSAEGLKFTDKKLVNFQSSSGNPRSRTKEWYENSWVASALDVEIKVPEQGMRAAEQSAEATPRLVDSGYLKGTVTDAVTNMPILDGQGNPIRVTIPVDRIVINANSTSDRFGITGSNASAETLDIQLGRGRRFQAALFLYKLPIPSSGARAILEAIFGRRLFTGRRK